MITPIILGGIAYLMRASIHTYFKKHSYKNSMKKVFLTLVASGFLFYAMNDGLEYGYFTLMRVVVCAVSIYLGYLAYEKNEKSIWVWLFGFVAVLFNPLVPIHLERQTWVPIDFFTGVFLLASLLLFRVKLRAKPEAE